MTDRELPAWAEHLPPDDREHRIVTCGGCGCSMSWRSFVDGHLEACPGGDDPDPPEAAA